MSNTNYTLKAMRVSDGIVQATEQPIWVGTSQVADAVNGRLATMSVTADRDWLWVRFSAQPSEKFKDKLVSFGFMFSRKRMGWHAPISEAVCKLLRDWGAITVHHHHIINLPKDTKPVEHITGDLDLDKPVIDAIASKEKKASKKQASQPQQQPATDMSSVMLALMEQVIALRNEVASLKASQVIKPVETHHGNGYHVGGVAIS